MKHPRLNSNLLRLAFIRSKNLWDNIKKSVKETSVTDVLNKMGAVPAGFRESTLGKLKLQGENEYMFDKKF